MLHPPLSGFEIRIVTKTCNGQNLFAQTNIPRVSIVFLVRPQAHDGFEFYLQGRDAARLHGSINLHPFFSGLTQFRSDRTCFQDFGEGNCRIRLLHPRG